MPSGLTCRRGDGERPARDEVHRDRVAREGVHGEHVEALRRLTLEREPGVAERELDLRLAVGEIGKFLQRDLHMRESMS